MASTIRLDVSVNKVQAQTDIQAIESEVRKLAAMPATINVNVKGAAQAANTFAKIALEQEKTAQSANRAAAAQARSADTITNTTNAAARLASAENRLAVEQEKTSQTANRLAIEQEKTNRAMQQGTDFADAFSVALGSIMARGFHLALSKITQGIREALSEMKEVDTQLTNISKVSGIAGKALADMGERAYETASKYGVAADEYLSSVYTFQKAGLGPSAEAMGELAVKTMLVGDTTADVASQFLISANAAWKYGGNMEKLNQLVDEADYINNNYATDLGKLSSGLPRVASIAAQAGMSAEQTLAALGTITAVTQESGTKAATALRALILNIEGQVGEFVDDTGETFKVTEESVKSMEGLMNKYAKAELEAAKASGELINPMTAIKAIFEGMANSDLNDQELFQLLSGMGGKLRTNQLTALVQNYQLFDEMLGKIANSAGTADSEIDKMMNSWERKAQVLKNTWTELISDIVDSDAIKGIIDGLTNAVGSLDKFVDKAKDPEYELSQVKNRIDEIKRAIKELRESDNPDPRRLHDLEVELELQNKILEVEQAKYDLENKKNTEKLYNQLTYDDLDLIELNALTNKLESTTFNGDIQAYHQTVKDIASSFKDYYENVIKVRDAGYELTESQQKFVDYYETVSSVAEEAELHTGLMRDGYREIVDAQGNIVAYAKEITPELEDQLSALEEQKPAGDKIKEFFKELINIGSDANAEYANMIAAITNSTVSVKELKKQEDDAATAGGSIAEAVGSIDFSTPTSGAAAFAAQLKVAQGYLSGLSVGFGMGFASGTTSAPGGPTLVNELGPELISENGRAYIANGGKPGIVNLSRGAIVLPANVTKEAIKGGSPAMNIHAAAAGRPVLITGGGGPTNTSSSARATGSVIFDGRNIANTGSGINVYIQTPKDAYNPDKPPVTTPPPKRGGGGGSSSYVETAVPEKTIEELAKELKDLLANLDKQAKLAENQKDYEKEADLYGQAQDAIDQMVADYRKAGYSDTSDEILDLLNKRYDYESKQETASEKFIKEAAKEFSDKLGNLDKQAKLANLNGDYDKEIKFYEKAQDAIGDMIDTYRAAGYSETSNEILDLLSKQYDYQSKIEAAAKKPQEEAEKAFKEAVQQMNDRLGNLDKQARIANLEGNYAKEAQLYEQTQEAIKDMVDFYRAAGYEDTSDEILALLSQNYDYANKQLSLYQTKWDELTKALKEDTDTQKQANVLAEKQQAVEEAREALANAQNQRTVRMYNAATGQWEWVADSKAVTSAEKALTTAETAYSDEVKSQTLSQAFKELEDMRNNVADLNNVVLGPALSSVLKMAESSNEFQNFARALNAVYGVGSYLSTTEGSSNVISTADSHDTVYTFGNITLTEEQASSMSVAELAQKLQVLKIS